MAAVLVGVGRDEGAQAQHERLKGTEGVGRRPPITETLSRAGHVVDSGGLHRLGTAFTSDVVCGMSAVGAGMPVINGTGAVRAGALRTGANGPIAHHVTNVVIVREDDGQALVDSEGLLLMSDGAVRGIVHHDVLRRTEDGWRSARRVVVPQRAALSGRSARSRPPVLIRRMSARGGDTQGAAWSTPDGTVETVGT